MKVTGRMLKRAVKEITRSVGGAQVKQRTEAALAKAFGARDYNALLAVADRSDERTDDRPSGRPETPPPAIGEDEAELLCGRHDITLVEADEEEIRGEWNWLGNGAVSDRSFPTRGECAVDAVRRLGLHSGGATAPAQDMAETGTLLDGLLDLLTTAQIEPHDIDELVYDTVDRCGSHEPASDINNGGLASQVAFLLASGWKPRDLLCAIGEDAAATFVIIDVDTATNLRHQGRGTRDELTDGPLKGEHGIVIARDPATGGCTLARVDK